MKKQNKGITLIALVITIIVLLILAGVAISMLSGENGILNQAANAKTETEKKSTEEAVKLAAMSALTAGKGKVDLGVLNSELSKIAGKTINIDLPIEDLEIKGEKFDINKNGTVTTADDNNQNGGTTADAIQIGTKVNYDETKNGAITGLTENMEWRVLGVNDLGQVELISTKPTTQTVDLTERKDLLNVLTLLDTECAKYGKGEKAASARSLTAEDINELAGYNAEGTGSKFTYKYSDDSVYGILSESITDENRNNTTGWFKHTEMSGESGKELVTPYCTINSTNPGPLEVENTDYNYEVSVVLKGMTPDNISWATIITNGEGGNDCIRQWLATIACQAGNPYFLDYNIFAIEERGESGRFEVMASHFGYVGSFRPVVTLQSNVELIPIDSNSDGIIDYYDI